MGLCEPTLISQVNRCREQELDACVCKARPRNEADPRSVRAQVASSWSKTIELWEKESEVEEEPLHQPQPTKLLNIRIPISSSLLPLHPPLGDLSSLCLRSFWHTYVAISLLSLLVSVWMCSTGPPALPRLLPEPRKLIRAIQPPRSLRFFVAPPCPSSQLPFLEIFLRISSATRLVGCIYLSLSTRFRGDGPLQSTIFLLLVACGPEDHTHRIGIVR